MYIYAKSYTHAYMFVGALVCALLLIRSSMIGANINWFTLISCY